MVKRDTLFEGTYRREGRAIKYDVFPSGNDLLMIRESSGASRPAVVLNWPEFLRRRGTGGR